MKINIRKGTLPIPIPQPVGGIMGLAKFSRDVIRALVALKNRQDSVQVPRRGGGGSSSPLPLTLKKGTDVDDIQIIPGYVNLEMPTLGGTALNHATPPEITVTADVWVWLKCVGTFGSPDTYVVTVETTTTATAPTGTTITAMLTIERHGYDGDLKFDVDNLPHGVIVDNIGLSGILVRAGETRRQIFLTAAEWVPETTRTYHAVAIGQGNQASRTLTLHVRRSGTVAAK